MPSREIAEANATSSQYSTRTIHGRTDKIAHTSLPASIPICAIFSAPVLYHTPQALNSRTRGEGLGVPWRGHQEISQGISRPSGILSPITLLPSPSQPHLLPPSTLPPSPRPPTHTLPTPLHPLFPASPCHTHPLQTHTRAHPHLTQTHPPRPGLFPLLCWKGELKEKHKSFSSTFSHQLFQLLGS